eukprot:g67282.t1
MRPRQDWCSSLGAQAQKLFKHSCEEAPLMELAKWGMAVVARIVEDTQSLPSLPRLLKAGSTGDFGCNQEGGAIHAPAKAQVDGQWVQLYVPRCLHGVRTPVCSL